jgi:hypothetical protein
MNENENHPQQTPKDLALSGFVGWHICLQKVLMHLPETETEQK